MSMTDLGTLFWFIVLGLLGGLAYCLIWAESWADIKEFKYSKRIFLGAIIGFLYAFLHSDYGFPDFVMSFVTGYMGTDFIIGLIDRLKKKPGDQNPP